VAKIVNVRIAGVGGQGILRTSQVLAEAARLHGYDVKQSELHGMSQRGGSVTSDVRFGPKVYSPLTPAGEVDFLLGLDDRETQRNLAHLRPTTGAALAPPPGAASRLADPRGVNMVLLGLLSRRLDIPGAAWETAIRAKMPPTAVEDCLSAFAVGEDGASSAKSPRR